MINKALIAFAAIFISLTTIGAGAYLLKQNKNSAPTQSLLRPLTGTPINVAVNTPQPSPSPSPTPVPTPTPTPKPLTFSELNALYGPCAYLPTLMYHHVQDLKIAQSEGHQSLTVDTQIFRTQMQYLKDHGYNVLPTTSIINFFESGTPIPKKSVMITFDDGYDDFGSDAAPILKEFNFPATMFVPTGLAQNGGYMTWEKIQELSSTQNILMANHTWSHHNMGANRATIEKEITLADTQLTDHGLNNPKVFAYPYGITSSYSEAFLQTKGYKVAFTTVHGSTLCQKQRFSLPRIRIGNTSLSYYGL